MSEPDSGSDLASLSTKATRDGDGWVLDGRKIWTTAAHENDWIIVLCRTTPRDEVDDKRQGMTQLHRRPEVARASTVTPIAVHRRHGRLLRGGVRPRVRARRARARRGRPGLVAEHVGARLRARRARPLAQLVPAGRGAAARDIDAPSNELRDLLGEAVANYWVLHQLSLSVARSIDRGGAPAIESSLVKEMGTRFEQDVVTAVLSPTSTSRRTRPTSRSSDGCSSPRRSTQPSFTIRGGTNEVLRSVASKGLRPTGAGR